MKIFLIYFIQYVKNKKMFFISTIANVERVKKENHAFNTFLWLDVRIKQDFLLNHKVIDKMV